MARVFKPPKTEQRASPRRIPRGTAQVECRRAMDAQSKNIASGLLDLSEGGVRVLLAESLEVSDPVVVALAGFGVPQAIERKAAVAWILTLENGRFVAGFKFELPLSQEDLLHFARMEEFQ